MMWHMTTPSLSTVTRRRRGPARRGPIRRDLTLLRTPSGWAIADAENRILFEASGTGSRPECLLYAERLGVPRIRAAH